MNEAEKEAKSLNSWNANGMNCWLALPPLLRNEWNAAPRSPQLRGKPKKQTKQFHSTRLGMESQRWIELRLLMRRELVGFALFFLCGLGAVAQPPCSAKKRDKLNQNQLQLLSFSLIINQLIHKWKWSPQHTISFISTPMNEIECVVWAEWKKIL